jgi:TetR/AcrR family transcriptional regulator, cholesterol catabolism regulator
MPQSSDSVSVRAPSGRTVERRNRDAEVFDAAIKIMATKGYSAMTIQEVADAVGVLKGSLYHYFSSKEDLLFSVIENSYLNAAAEAKEVAALGLGPLEELLEYLRRQVVWYLNNQDLAKIYQTEARHLKGERLEQMKQRGRNYEKYMVDLIVAAQENGTIQNRAHPRIIFGYVGGALESVRNWSGGAFRSRSHQELTDAFLDLTRHAIQATV